MKPPGTPISGSLLEPHRDHSRLFQRNLIVYPVLSRRSRGISVGINLNPDKICNFDCVYCQVDRSTPPETREVDTARLLHELEGVLDLVQSGRLYDDDRFAAVPEPLRRLNDLAFSGDGEPTTCPSFLQVVYEVAVLKRRRKLDTVKLVLITNASMFHRTEVRGALTILDESNGEIWAKLDAGTEGYYQAIDRTRIPFERILTNIRDAARIRPLVIQSLFMTVDGNGPNLAEIDAYCRRLGEILASGGRIASVQVYTVARPPAEKNVGPLPAAELDHIGLLVARRLEIPVDVVPGGTEGS
jgi:wyosine [tRNA(Phe)-imidazoG37] synthetase (radical SAM superfamily)